MANRSYLYAYNAQSAEKLIGLSEWKYQIPLIHKIIMGGNPELVDSYLWDAGGKKLKIAIKADLAVGYESLLIFMNWMKTAEVVNRNEFNHEYDNMIKFWQNKLGYQFVWLEAGEIFMMHDSDLEADARNLLVNINQVTIEINRLKTLSGNNILHQSTIDELRTIPQEWENNLGLYWSEELWFNLS